MNADKAYKNLYKDPRYVKGYKDGGDHQSPSPLTLKFMEQTRLFNQEIKQEVDYIKQQLKKIPTTDEMVIVNKEIVEKLLCKMNEMLDKHELKSDEKYAIKQVEDAVKKISENINWAIKIVIGLVITAIVSLVIISK